MWARFEIIDLLGVKHEGGSSVTPREISVTGTIKDEVKVIGSGVTWDYWVTGSEEPLTDFDFLYIESDLDGVVVEITTDKGADVGTVVSTLELMAGLPLMLNSDGSWANYTVDFAAGTLDVIDQIRIRNPAGSANVHAVLVT